jgi:hypothetical protein
MPVISMYPYDIDIINIIYVLRVRKDPALTVTICNSFSSIDNFYNKKNRLWSIAEKNRYVADCNVTPVLYFSPKKTVASLILICFIQEKAQ